MNEIRIHRKAKKGRYSVFVLGGDIGGTNSRLAVAGIRKNRPEILFSMKFSTLEMDSVIPAIREAINRARREGIRISRACIGAAGPVSDKGSRVELTHAALVIDAREIAEATGIKRVSLINDFEAVGYGINVMGRGEVDRVKKFQRRREGRIAVIGAGTGLGKTVLEYRKEKGIYIPSASEGGHADFPAQEREELEFLEFVKAYRKVERVSYDDVLSSKGIECLYLFMRRKHGASRYTKEIVRSQNIPEAVSRLRKKDELCREVFRWWGRLMGRCARNFALDTLAKGGVYITGGVVMGNPDAAKSREFVSEFEKGRMRGILKKIPLYVMRSDDAGLYGACLAAHAGSDD